MTRKMISSGRLGARPQKNDARVKPVTEAMRRRLRPKRFASQPVMGKMIAFATRYDVSAQVASSGVAEREPAMCGNETLTTVVSSTSMKVLIITAEATSHGLISRAGAGAATSYWLPVLPRTAETTTLLAASIPMVDSSIRL